LAGWIPGSHRRDLAAKFPAVGVTEGYRSGDTTPHRHMATDRFATINIDYLKSTTVLVSQVIADLVR
jgi:hypothetical protein